MSNKLLSFIFKNNKYVGIPKESHKHLYDNQISGLTAGTTGDALDELAETTSQISSKLNRLGFAFKSIESGVTNVSSALRESNNIGYVCLAISISKTLTSGTPIKLCTLNKTMRANYYAPCCLQQESGSRAVGHLTIATDGSIKLTPYANITYTAGATYAILILANFTCEFADA